MKISYNWLHDFVDFRQSPEELAEMLTWLGFEVDKTVEIGASWTDVVVGKVLECEAVPKSDHLSYCKVDAGVGETLGIVCGAPNVAAGQVVPVAVVGAELQDGFKITERKLRGVVSRGMICSERELGISDEAAGIMVLPDDLKIGSALENHIGKRDWVFDLEITLNRPDCLSHTGIAREIAAVVRKELRLPVVEVIECDEPADKCVSVDIQAPGKCPRYSARVLKGVLVAPSPLWMQERLRAVGIRPISNVVDVTNYVLMELGHPLHAFDYHLVADGGIIVRTANPGEKFTTLDEKEHTLSDTDLLIADKEKGIALAGVMGGLNSEIKDDTEDVLLECAYFEPVGVRITSRDRGISSESSHRFERGVDPEMTPFAINRTADLIHRFAGGKILKGIVDNYPRRWRKHTIKLRPVRSNKMLGIRIQAYKMENYLKALGCAVDRPDEKYFHVIPPSWRHDLQREIDLIEEVARIHGYDRIPEETVSSLPLKIDTNRERERRLIDRIKSSLVELGMHEAITVSLVSEADVERFSHDKEPVKLINPLSEDMSTLRTSLGLTLLRVAEKNIRAGNSDLRLFEWGKCFWMENGKLAEGWRLAGLVSGSVRPETWVENARDYSIHDLKGLISQFIQKISLDNVQYIYYDIVKFLIKGGGLLVGEGEQGIPIGYFGQIRPEIAERFSLEIDLWYFDFDGERLLSLAGETPQLISLPRYPAAQRDLSFIIDNRISAGQLETIIRNSGGDTLVDVCLFDVYNGRGIPAGKKSLAYHLIYRSAARTLSDAEVDQAIETIVKSANSEIGAELRTI